MNKMYHIYLDLRRQINQYGKGKLYIIEDGVTTTFELPSYYFSGREDFGTTTSLLCLRAQNTSYTNKYFIRSYGIGAFGDNSLNYPSISDIEAIVNN